MPFRDGGLLTEWGFDYKETTKGGHYENSKR